MKVKAEFLRILWVATLCQTLLFTEFKADLSLARLCVGEFHSEDE